MAFSIPTISQLSLPTTRPSVANAPAEPRPALFDVFTPSEPNEFPQFPKPGAFGPVKPTAPVEEKQLNMAELDQQAADFTDQGTQQILNMQPVPERNNGGGMITNFNAQAMDQQMMISDMRAAQAIQRQTQLALRDKKVPDNKLTQAAMERRQAALKEKLTKGQHYSGQITNFSSQAFDQQKQIIETAEKKGWPTTPTVPTTQPAAGNGPRL